MATALAAMAVDELSADNYTGPVQRLRLATAAILFRYRPDTNPERAVRTAPPAGGRANIRLRRDP